MIAAEIEDNSGQWSDIDIGAALVVGSNRRFIRCKGCHGRVMACLAQTSYFRHYHRPGTLPLLGEALEPPSGGFACRRK
jgi:hypothetical protein